MSEVARLRDQLERAHRGEAWHGPSLGEILEGVGAEEASARPLPGTHTIFELVLHITAWENEAIARLRGLGRDLPDEEDWPRTDAGWRDAVHRLEEVHRNLLVEMGELDDSSLDTRVQGFEQTVYVLLHGVVQHTLYHAGQIALLKKALRTRPSVC